MSRTTTAIEVSIIPKAEEGRSAERWVPDSHIIGKGTVGGHRDKREMMGPWDMAGSSRSSWEIGR